MTVWRERAVRVMLGVVFACALVWGGYWAAHKAYAIDEFYYAHEAWELTRPGASWLKPLVAGERFLPLYVFAPVIALTEDDPARLIWVRYEMIVLWGLLLLGMGRLSYRLTGGGRCAAAVAIATAALVRPLMWYAVELRPDPVALVCVVWSLVCLSEAAHRDAKRRWSAAAGLLLFLGCCASVKALVYGGPFLLAAILGLPKRYRGHFEAPWHFSLSFGAGLTVTGLLVLWRGDFATYWDGIFGMIKLHEEHYPELDPWRLAIPVMGRYPWLVVLTGLGALSLLMRWGQRLWRAREGSLGLLVVLVWVGAAASFLMQRGAYDYSLLPALVMSCVLSAVAVHDRYVALMASGRAVRCAALAVGVCVIGLVAWKGNEEAQRMPRNDAQRVVQRDIHRLTAPDDVAYDLSAAFVFRPRAHRFAFVDMLRAKLYREELNQKVPELLRERGAVLFVNNARFNPWRKQPLGRFIARHYQRYSDDLALWGRRWTQTRAPWADKFEAIVAGEYFVHPPEALTRGALTVDGVPVTAPVMKLTRGEHHVRWQPAAGAQLKGPLYMIWLPRDGEPFDPARPSAPASLGRYILPGGVLE